MNATFVPTELSLTIDTRDFPGSSDERRLAARRRRPLRRSHDRVATLYKVRRRGRRLPADRRRPRRARAAWLVCRASDTRDGRPCRSTCSRASAASTRCARTPTTASTTTTCCSPTPNCGSRSMTHLDLAVFADAGNVAARAERSRSGEAILWRRLSAAYAPRDVRDGRRRQRRRRLARPFRLKDPLGLARITKKSAARAVRAVARRYDDDRVPASVTAFALTRDRSAHGVRRRQGAEWPRPHQPPAGASMWIEPTDLAEPRSVLRSVGMRSTRRIRRASIRSSSASTPASISA